MDKKQTKKIQEHPNVKMRQPPQNYEAEKAVLGCIMLDNQPALLIGDGLQPSDFASPAYRCVFEAMVSLSLKDQPIDIVTIMQQLNVDGMVERAGGVAVVSTLMDIVPSSSSFKYYKDIVVKNGNLRRLIDECNRITEHCFAGDPTENALQMAETAIYGLSEKNDKSSLLPLQIGLMDAINQIEKLSQDPKALRGVPTPYKQLNHLLGGLQRSDLILIAARPGQGKTSIGMNLITHAAMSNSRKTDSGSNNPFKCAVFSLEMPSVQLAKRMLCSVAGVDMHKVNSGDITDSKDWKDLFYAKSRLDETRIFIDDSSLTTPVEILSKCRRLKRESGLDLVMIDYLQLMSSGKRTESRQQEISEITRTLKIAAKELDVPILLLSQMSRDIEKRTDKTPQMSDLRESGAIEQDADIIIFIHRKHDANDETVDLQTRNKVELHIAKHRNGSTGKIELIWEGKTTSFRDYTPNGYIPPKVANSQNKQSKGNSTINNIKIPNPQDVFGTPPPEIVEQDKQALQKALQDLEDSGL
ncbi:MAG: replicative DNA helicase [Firmicutes bacterium]|nr:replicative DNA helicase [Bacillota bacterium]MCL1954293.1 replicative DNA helicase [Bacillota bacterium]